MRKDKRVTVLSWGCHGVVMGLPWGCRGVVMGVVMGLPWGCHGVVMGLPWGCHGVVMGLSWGCHGAYGIPLGYSKDNLNVKLKAKKASRKKMLKLAEEAQGKK